MAPGTVRCATILIYIRGLHPSLNQGTTSSCYLNDKRQLQESSTQKTMWTNQFRFQSGKDTRPRALTLMRKGSSASLKRHKACCSVPSPTGTPHHTSLLILPPIGTQLPGLPELCPLLQPTTYVAFCDLGLNYRNVLPGQRVYSRNVLGGHI